MANIRIKDLSTTAAVTASDDFIAVDGATNGTRKLNAFSPTFGGNLTVSGGTGTIDATSGTASATLNLVGRSSGAAKTASILANSGGSLVLGAEGAGSSLTIAANTGNTTVGYNLTVSGSSTTVGGQNANAALTIYSDNSTGVSILNFQADSAIIKAAIYGAKVGGTGGSLTLKTKNASGGLTDALTLSEAQNATIAGNLTVSGGGTSSFAGNITLSTSGSSINTGTSDASDNKYISLSGGGAAANTRGASVYVTGNEFTTGNAKGSLQFEAGYDATMSNTLDGSVLFSTGGTSVVGYFNRLGNLILGPAAADSGNGKLQLATHTTSAGGIGFGTDTALYRTSAGVLGISGAVNAAIELYGSAAGIKAITMFEAGTIAAQVSCVSGSFQLKTGSTPTTALTLDASQNATFAGTVTATGNVSTSKSVVGGSVVLSARNTDNTNSVSAAVAQLTVGGASAGDPRLLFTVDAVQDWSVGVDNSDGDKFKIGPSSAVGTSTSLTLDPSTSNATFAGSIAIGNTVQTAAAIASTHKVTISIGGATYYLLATNV